MKRHENAFTSARPFWKAARQCTPRALEIFIPYLSVTVQSGKQKHACYFHREKVV